MLPVYCVVGVTYATEVLCACTTNLILRDALHVIGAGYTTLLIAAGR
jgi:hypothetical protein